MRIMPTSVMPSKVSELVRNLVDDIDVLGITKNQTTLLEKIYVTKTS
jgi:hypothetical protein